MGDSMVGMVFITLATLVGLGFSSLPDDTTVLVTEGNAVPVARGEVQDYTLTLKTYGKGSLPAEKQVNLLIQVPKTSSPKWYKGTVTGDGKDILLDFGPGRNSFRKILSENYKIRLKIE